MDNEKARPGFFRSATGVTFTSVADLKEYEENRHTIKGKLQDFCSATSFTPISQVYKAGSLWKKFCWVVVSLGLSGYMIYQCLHLIQNYLTYPSEVDMKLAFATQMDFPSVTICNLNPIRFSKLSRSQFAKDFEDFLEDESSDVLYLNARNRLLKRDSSEESDESKEVFYEGPTPPEFTYPTHAEIPEMYTEPGGDAGEDLGDPSTWTPSNAYTDNSKTTESETTASLVSSLPHGTTTWKSPAASESPPPPPQRKRRRRATTNETLSENAANFTSALVNSTYNQWEYLDEANEDSFYNKMSPQHLASEKISDIVASMSPEAVEQMGHRKKDLLMSCKWQGFPCSPRNFTSFVNYKYGNCFTFNAHLNESSLKTSNPGPLYGLELELFIEQNEYTPVVTQEAGARVVVHSRGKKPFPEDEGFTVSPGFLTSIGMRKTSIVRLSLPHGNCTTEFGKIESLYTEETTTQYSKQACLKSCYQLAIISRCGCGIASIPLPGNVSLCLEKDKQCQKDVEWDHKQNNLDCEDACPLPCSEEAFTLTVSNAAWPAENYRRDLEAKMARASTKLWQSVHQDGSEYDVAKVEIYYQELNYQLIEQKPSYQFQNIVSDLGGQLGLWLGVSILAFGEILDFIISVLQYCFFKITSARLPKRGSTPIYPYRPPED